ncbi:ABC transporter ATP-binding protein arb1 [Exophiala xenobiotica]|nr:ABC transporter ATP-binding protein arb1 [Exophiala xenobiotica]KAK5242229.1 ABC transporter ATP-binding protein arb1 [Exophiala xenobiotica]KAK5311562.1 ABC transporter ATP-binding protein arb1 [Exophiala xenobiotica]KAK5344346.1 ABC transporter ATP-binding protein arb1 [Exophiala xenobiotica]KAK5430779.1 ABC transporter ATP-binding protein arb1 [Exophiala xenobiotica]
MPHVTAERELLASSPDSTVILALRPKDIMVCENKTVRRWDGSIGDYKNYFRKKMVLSNKAM